MILPHSIWCGEFGFVQHRRTFEWEAHEPPAGQAGPGAGAVAVRTAPVCLPQTDDMPFVSLALASASDCGGAGLMLLILRFTP